MGNGIFYLCSICSSLVDKEERERERESGISKFRRLVCNLIQLSFESSHPHVCKSKKWLVVFVCINRD